MKRWMCALMALLLIVGSAPALAQNQGTMVLEMKKISVSMSVRKATVDVGNTLQLVANVKPVTAPQEIQWKSSRPSVASVDDSGLVTANGKGTCKITARDAKGRRATCKITVRVPVTGITMKKDMLALVKGKSAKLSYRIEPNNASNKKVTWRSSNKKVATVSKSGKIRAKRLGSCTITATTKEGGFVAKCELSVVKNKKLIKNFMPETPSGPMVLEDLAVSVDGVMLSTEMTFDEVRQRLPSWAHSTYDGKYEGKRYHDDSLFSDMCQIAFRDGKLTEVHAQYVLSEKRDDGYFTRYTSHHVVSPRGIQLNSTMDDVIEAYGVPHYGDAWDDDTWYFFGYKVPHGNKRGALSFRINRQSERVTQIEVMDDWL